MEIVEPVPGDRRLECLVHEPELGERVAQVRAAQERRPPDRGGVTLGLAGLASMFSADLERARDPRLERVVAGFEPEHEDRVRAIAATRQQRLLVTEQAAVARVQSRLRDASGGLHRVGEVLKVDRRSRAVPRARLQAHPRLADHAEGPLRAAEQPLGSGTGAGGGQPSGLEQPARRDDADRFDELVDVGVQRREVTPRPRRDPPSEGRVLKRLREVAERQPVRAQLRLECRALRPGRDPRGAGDGVDLEHAGQASHVDADRAAVPVTHVGLHAPDDARSAPVRDRRGTHVAAPLENREHVALVAWECDQVRRVVEVAAHRADQIADRLAVRVRGALVRIVREPVCERRRRAQAGRRQVEFADGRRVVDAEPVAAEALGVGPA